MRRKLFIKVRSGLTGLLLVGTMGTLVAVSAIAADYHTPSYGGYPPMEEPTQDAALLLASRSATPTPLPPQPVEEKKAPWWSTVFPKKNVTPPTTPKAIVEPVEEKAPWWTTVFPKKDAAPSVAPNTPSTPIEPPSTGKFKSSKADPKTAPMFSSKKQGDSADSGQAEVANFHKERQYSEVDYIASATTPKDTKARNLYNDGLLAESQGRNQDAIRAYNGFIKANEQSTSNGVLAAPYHRLAMISWKAGNTVDAEIYFRHALNYALGGNLLIIGGDYAQFLMVKGDYRKAEVILRNALIHDPENKRLLLHLGRCVAFQKRHQESLRYLEASVGRALAYEELAVIYRQQGDMELARVAEERRNRHLGFHHSPSPAQGHVAVDAQQQIPMPVPERLPNHQVPSSGWTAAQQQQSAASQPVVPAVPSVTPVSRVFHYPSNSPTPVYYQYTGNEYPQSPSGHSWDPPTVPNVGWNYGASSF